MGRVKLGKIGKGGESERNVVDIKRNATFSPGPLGQQLSSFLIEHSFAAEKNNPAPSEEEICKLEFLARRALTIKGTPMRRW